MKTVHLLVGVPCSGKTWVASQLKDKFLHVPHDEVPVDKYHHMIFMALGMTKRPVLAEAPFRTSHLIKQLTMLGVNVKTYYLRASEHTIASRYMEREGKACPTQHLTNLKRYNARDWDAQGSSQDILKHLRSV